mmetsp:Transcript_49872/g.157046  ORF Transcript_49872/g.157046 Transcript_49872/m.157046 type:complete len:104 (+) Transcript_49872:500-811(+)
MARCASDWALPTVVPTEVRPGAEALSCVADLKDPLPWLGASRRRESRSQACAAAVGPGDSGQTGPAASLLEWTTAPTPALTCHEAERVVREPQEEPLIEAELL